MPESQLTKRVLATAVKELMKKTPLSKISVRDITEYCGVNRNTFYYHFKDKYELVNWVFYTEALEQISGFSDREHWTAGLLNLLEYMRKNKEFYTNALKDKGQNCFAEYLVEFYKNILTSCIDELRGDTVMDPDDIDFIARFNTYAFVGLIFEWANNGMKEDPRERVEHIRALIDSSLFYQIIDQFRQSIAAEGADDDQRDSSC